MTTKTPSQSSQQNSLDSSTSPAATNASQLARTAKILDLRRNAASLSDVTLEKVHENLNGFTSHANIPLFTRDEIVKAIQDQLKMPAFLPSGQLAMPTAKAQTFQLKKRLDAAHKVLDARDPMSSPLSAQTQSPPKTPPGHSLETYLANPPKTPLARNPPLNYLFNHLQEGNPSTAELELFAKSIFEDHFKMPKDLIRFFLHDESWIGKDYLAAELGGKFRGELWPENLLKKLKATSTRYPPLSVQELADLKSLYSRHRRYLAGTATEEVKLTRFQAGRLHDLYFIRYHAPRFRNMGRPERLDPPLIWFNVLLAGQHGTLDLTEAFTQSDPRLDEIMQWIDDNLRYLYPRVQLGTAFTASPDDRDALRRCMAQCRPEYIGAGFDHHEAMQRALALLDAELVNAHKTDPQQMYRGPYFSAICEFLFKKLARHRQSSPPSREQFMDDVLTYLRGIVIAQRRKEAGLPDQPIRPAEIMACRSYAQHHGEIDKDGFIILPGGLAVLEEALLRPRSELLEILQLPQTLGVQGHFRAGA